MGTQERTVLSANVLALRLLLNIVQIPERTRTKRCLPDVGEENVG